MPGRRDLSRFVRANLRGRAAIKPAPTVARAVAALTKDLGIDSRSGPAMTEIAARWPEIVGDKLAKLTSPAKITGRGDRGVLHLRVKGAGAVLVNAETARILERVNTFCGAPVAGKIAILRAPAAVPARGPAAGLSPSQALELEAGLDRVQHPRLKAALKRFGRGALRRGT